MCVCVFIYPSKPSNSCVRLLIPSSDDSVRHSVAGCMTVLSRLSRMRGSALEACLKELVLALRAQREPQLPTEFYFKLNDRTPGGMVQDLEILKLMWPLAKKVQKLLERSGFAFKYAQSTYVYTGAARATRSKKGFSVDLTVMLDGKRFWLEVKYTDKNTLADALKAGEVSLKHYREAATVAKDWKLDDNLGGWRMRAPDGYGKVACNQHECHVTVDGVAPIRCTWQSQRNETPLRTEQMRQFQRAWREKNNRSTRREKLRTLPVVLKKPRAPRSGRRACSTR